MADETMGLDDFIETVGSGLSNAQGKIAGGELDTTAMAVNEATLEARVVLDVDSAGVIRVGPVSREQIKSLGGAADALSTVTVNFVALTSANDPVGAPKPPLSKEAAIRRLSQREDVARLADVLGPLDFKATFVASRAAWLVTAVDERGRRVREVLIDKEG